MPILIKGRGVRRLQRKKQNFIQGAFILMLASLLVKVIGAFFQRPLLNMIGGKDSPAFGMFSAAYRVYTAMLMISTVGVPAALPAGVRHSGLRMAPPAAPEPSAEVKLLTEIRDLLKTQERK